MSIVAAALGCKVDRCKALFDEKLGEVRVTAFVVAHKQSANEVALQMLNVYPFAFI